MRRGRGVTPPSVERSFGLQYYPTCLASSSRVKTCRGRRGARQGASSSHQEWGRAHEGATRGQREYRRVTPFEIAVGMHARGSRGDR